MTNLKSRIVSVLTSATGIAEVFFFYPKSFAKLPCVSYFERSNRVAAWADDSPAVSGLEYQVQIWGKSSQEISALAGKADAGLAGAGFIRQSAEDRYDPKSELYYKDMVYRAVDAAGKTVRVGVSDLTVYQVTSDDPQSGYATKLPYYFENALISLDLKFDVPGVSLEAEDQTVECAAALAGIDVSISLLDVSPSEAAMLYGQAASGGVITAGAADDPPYFCVSFRSKKSGGGYRYYKIFKAKAFLAPDSFATAYSFGETPPAAKLTLRAIPTASVGAVYAVMDDADPAVTPDALANWLADGSYGHTGTN